MAKSINVLIAHFLPDLVSGAEYAILDMIDRGNGQFNYLMLTPGEGRLADVVSQRGYPVWSQKIETRRRLFPGLHEVQSFQFSRQLMDRQIDVVLCNTFPAASRVGTACRWAGIPYGIYVREYIRNRPVHERILAQGTKVFAVSRDVKRHLTPMTDPTKIVTCYDHIHIRPIQRRVCNHFDSGRRILPFPKEQPVVGLVGRITPYKQQDLFIRSIPKILSRAPEARFVIVGNARGSDKDYEQEIHQLTARLGLENKLAFMGYRRDAPEIISELTLLCVTSSREPFPRTLLEAQTIGCPVVAAMGGGCPEMVLDGVTGLLFSADVRDSDEQLSERVIRLLRNRGLRDRLSTQAKKSVQQTFGSPEPVRHFENEISKLIRRVQIVTITG